MRLELCTHLFMCCSDCFCCSSACGFSQFQVLQSLEVWSHGGEEGGVEGAHDGPHSVLSEALLLGRYDPHRDDFKYLEEFVEVASAESSAHFF